MKKLGLNYILNLIYEILLIVVPLVVTPYVSRILEPDGIGKYSYCVSIVYYFTTAAYFGFTSYSQREIAKYENDDANQINNSINILLDMVILTLIISFSYIIMLISGIFGGYENLLWIMLINIIAIPFDLTFYYKGNENFKIIVFRNIIIKIVSIVFIFIFVKEKQDLTIYVFINSASILISNLSLWLPFLKKIFQSKSKIKISFQQILKHFKGATIYFIPTIAISISTMIDNTLIGVLVKGDITNENGEIIRISDLENGYYSQASKIVKMLITAITSLSFVILPRNTYEFERQNIDNAKKNMYWAYQIIFMIGMPLILGMIAVSNNFVPWFLGEGYEKCVYLIIILSPMILFNGITSLIGYSWLIPIGKVNSFTIVVTIIAFANLIVSATLIPYYGAYGAIIGTLIAELIGSVISYIFVMKNFSLKLILKSIYKYLISSILMFIIVYSISFLLSSSVLNTIILIMIGIVSYFLSLILFKDELCLKYISKVFKSIFKTKK